jgi:hypothetical protein
VPAIMIPLAVLTAVLPAACSDQAGPHPAPAARVRLSYCGGPAQARPDVVGVVCATNSITARNLTWSGWGKPVASAIGTAVVNLCAYTDCHTGRYRAVPVVLVASKIVSCPRRGRAYSRLQYLFVGRSPFQGVPAHMKYPSFWWGSHRPSPGDQTVSLTCG